ncbi:MAG: POTRA domain-containing protein [Candidatus Krumholzibacteriota bacterium]
MAATAGAAEDPGLTVGEIEIESRDIYSPGEIEHTNGALRLLRRTMNGVHFNTRQYVLRRELLFRPGDPFVPDRLAETERNLRRLGYLNDVKVTAVDTTADGRVNIKVSAQESWTLRTSFSYSLASGGDQRWSVQLADRNFLGHGVTLGAGLGEDENTSFWNTWFRQQRLLGTDLSLGIDYASRQDGYLRQVFLSRPFYALGDSWMMDLKFWDNLADHRYYLSNAGPAGGDPARNASLYAKLPYHHSGMEGGFQFRLTHSDEGRLWRLGGGVRVAKTTFDLNDPGYILSDGRTEDLTWLADAEGPFARDQGTTVFPYVWLHTLGRNWDKGRFVLQYGPVEDIALEFDFDLRAGPTGGSLGSTTGYSESRFRFEGRFTKWSPLAGGHLLFFGAGDADTGRRDVRTYRYDLVTGWVFSRGAEMSPWTTRVFAEYGQGQNLLGSRALLLGLDRGMRTLEFDGMAGDRLVRWNVEQGKATPVEIAGLFRLGFAAFYSGGRAWWRDEDRDSSYIRHEAGFGLRFGPTRSANSQIARIDLAWDLNGDGGPVITAITRGLF